MFLNELKIGQTAIIKNINVKKCIKRRLLDLGIIENTKVKCILKSPLNDPKAYLIRGTIISLRKEDTSRIEVEFF